VKELQGEPVYVCGGNAWSLTPSGDLRARQDVEAGVYVWPFAHNVRPAHRALGAAGCSDCHAQNSRFFFAEVRSADFGELDESPAKPMYAFMHVSPAMVRAWAPLIRARVPILAFAIAASALLVALLVRYILRALAALGRLAEAGTVPPRPL